MLGSSILDGARQQTLNFDDLKASLSSSGLTDITLLSTTTLAGARNLRHSFKLYVKQMVASRDTTRFSSALEAIWRQELSGEDYISHDSAIFLVTSLTSASQNLHIYELLYILNVILSRKCTLHVLSISF